jgi:outer membrane protein
MKMTTPLTLLAGAVLASAVVSAQAQDAARPGFYAAIGVHSVNPKSGNGTLAGAFKTDINSDTEPSLTLGLRVDEHWSAEAFLPLTKFKHDVRLNGAKSASIKHMPFLLTAQYHFLPESRVQPFIGAGYGWVSVSGERTTGPIAGTRLNVKNGDGFVGQFGVDYMAGRHLFVRGDVRYFDWKSKVDLNGAGIGQVKVNPWIYGVSVGYRF